jgi:hypothetical protein
LNGQGVIRFANVITRVFVYDCSFVGCSGGISTGGCIYSLGDILFCIHGFSGQECSAAWQPFCDITLTNSISGSLELNESVGLKGTSDGGNSFCLGYDTAKAGLPILVNFLNCTWNNVNSDGSGLTISSHSSAVVEFSRFHDNSKQAVLRVESANGAGDEFWCLDFYGNNIGTTVVVRVGCDCSFNRCSFVSTSHNLLVDVIIPSPDGAFSSSVRFAGCIFDRFSYEFGSSVTYESADCDIITSSEDVLSSIEAKCFPLTSTSSAGPSVSVGFGESSESSGFLVGESSASTLSFWSSVSSESSSELLPSESESPSLSAAASGSPSPGCQVISGHTDRWVKYDSDNLQYCYLFEDCHFAALKGQGVIRFSDVSTRVFVYECTFVGCSGGGPSSEDGGVYNGGCIFSYGDIVFCVYGFSGEDCSAPWQPFCDITLTNGLSGSLELNESVGLEGTSNGGNSFCLGYNSVQPGLPILVNFLNSTGNRVNSDSSGLTISAHSSAVIEFSRFHGNSGQAVLRIESAQGPVDTFWCLDFFKNVIGDESLLRVGCDCSFAHCSFVSTGSTLLVDVLPVTEGSTSPTFSVSFDGCIFDDSSYVFGGSITYQTADCTAIGSGDDVLSSIEAQCFSGTVAPTHPQQSLPASVAPTGSRTAPDVSRSPTYSPGNTPIVPPRTTGVPATPVASTPLPHPQTTVVAATAVASTAAPPPPTTGVAASPIASTALLPPETSGVDATPVASTAALPPETSGVDATPVASTAALPPASPGVNVPTSSGRPPSSSPVPAPRPSPSRPFRASAPFSPVPGGGGGGGGGEEGGSQGGSSAVWAGVGAALGVIAAAVAAAVFFILWNKRSRGDSLHHYSDEMETVDGDLEFEHEVSPRPTSSPVITATNPDEVDLHGFTFYADEGIGVD